MLVDPQFLTSTLGGGEWSVSLPSRFTTRGKPPGTRSIGGWMGPRAGLDTVEYGKISCPRRESKPVGPARSYND
jgi:hypothetical protein